MDEAKRLAAAKAAQAAEQAKIETARSALTAQLIDRRDRIEVGLAKLRDISVPLGSPLPANVSDAFSSLQELSGFVSDRLAEAGQESPDKFQQTRKSMAFIDQKTRERLDKARQAILAAKNQILSAQAAKLAAAQKKAQQAETALKTTQQMINDVESRIEALDKQKKQLTETAAAQTKASQTADSNRDKEDQAMQSLKERLDVISAPAKTANSAGQSEGNQ